ncbi:MAG: DUF1553 domain-containing protein [Verrucomicrobiaceae bacterium]|nr:DUF1553 domain-containing protein [Verrucomicrobiaceae bacterium]
MLRYASLSLLAATSIFAVDFSHEVFPVLQRACFECHGPEVQKGQLRLDLGSPRHAEIGADLLRRVQLPREDKEAMPKRGTRLQPAEIAALKTWIDSGAKWPAKIEPHTHWSYLPPQRPQVPAGTKNPVDAFIRQKLTAAGLQPAPPAAPEILIRRLSLDLTGLPPAPAEVDAFVSAMAKETSAQSAVLSAQSKTDKRSTSSFAYEALVDRLLASEQFGVRWARPWLDLARYADSHGFQRDDLRDIWAYRDWVVDALNANMPFDQFTLEQIAGDLIPNAKPSQIIATGFHRCTPTNVEAGTEPEESRINQVIDRVNTTGAVWLGTTLECAQCHNHKYDPFTQKDFYSLLAYYNNTEKEAERTNPKTPGSIQFNGTAFELPDAQRQSQRRKITAEIQTLDHQIAAATTTAQPSKKATANAFTLLKPEAFITESDAETELQPDGSTLLTGPVPDTDTYTVEAPLTAGALSGLFLEALTHPSIPGEGPGRGGANRPNFVLHTFDCTLTLPDGKTQPLKFKSAHADYSQANYPVENLITRKGSGAWAIGRRFGQPHWAAFELEKPLPITAGTKLTIRMEQNFGNGLVIGCMRLSSITGDVAANLPASESEAQTAQKDPAVLKLEKQRAQLQKQLTALKRLSTEVMKELPQPRMSAIFKRGVYTDPTTPVTATTPAIFKKPASGPPNRLTLAKWLTSRDNPLAARVTVNRWWAEIFGQGIVTTLEDFGIKGAAPSHPEMLDWLACEFMDSGWDMKHILKLIVMSDTYLQSSSSGQGAQLDPTNALLSHFPRFRLDAEAIRDNALSIAGLLDLKQGGVPIRPPQPEGLWRKVGGQQYDYQVSPGSEKHRRGLYVVLKRGSPYPSFMNFDASARMACVVRRSRSNTPLQALTLLNDPVYVEAAKHFALRIAAEAPSSDLDARISHAFRIALARAPTAAEARVLKTLWEQQYEAAQTDLKATTALLTDITLPPSLTPTEFSAHYALATALMNLDECITKP